MKVINTHQRLIAAPREKVGQMMDTLASREDAVWPSQFWPRMRLDRPLGVGAAGGHGPIRYFVEEYQAGQCVRFRFTRPQGFDGWHALTVGPQTGSACMLTHTLQMNTRGLALVLWPWIIRPLHDALLEDALSKVQLAVGERPEAQRWSWHVRFLRWLASRRGNPKQGV